MDGTHTASTLNSFIYHSPTSKRITAFPVFSITKQISLPLFSVPASFPSAFRKAWHFLFPVHRKAPGKKSSPPCLRGIRKVEALSDASHTSQLPLKKFPYPCKARKDTSLSVPRKVYKVPKAWQPPALQYFLFPRHSVHGKTDHHTFSSRCLRNKNIPGIPVRFQK